ncbi:hypothetical protein LUW77_03215 [Streptomyces radiopugnans]|nr:hypothetical protein LUW77_03215 [Streptomyces radiopugnans]
MTTKRPLPDHGTEARYQGSTTRPPCRCRTCITGWSRVGQRRELARLQGRPASIPSAAITAHIKTLTDSGMSAGQIAAAVGVNSSTICEHAEGRWLKIHRTTAEKILTVQPGQYGNLGQVPALGTRRRIQALYAIGHGVTALAAATGLTANGIAKIAYGQAETVSARTRDTIAATYRTLATQPGASHRAQQRATRQHWAPPAAWDDDIDNPDARPDWTGYCGTDRGWWLHRAHHLPMCDRCEVAHEQWLSQHRHLPRVEFMSALSAARTAATDRGASIAADALELEAQGCSRAEAALRLGVTKGAIEKNLNRYRDQLGEAA